MYRRFWLFDTKWHQYYTRPTIFGYLLYNTHGITITASVCLSERLTVIIRILGERLKSIEASFQGIVWTKWVFKCKGARGALHILFLWFLVLGVALYDEIKLMLCCQKFHGNGKTNHRHAKLIILQVWNVYHKHCSSYSRISQCCVSLCTEYMLWKPRLTQSEKIDTYYR